MRRYVFAVAILLWACKAIAEVEIKSCDSVYSAKYRQGSLVIERLGKPIGSKKIDHVINGGIFSRDDSLIVVYGMPRKVSRRNPQKTLLSVYRIIPNPTLIISEVYGAGIYDAKFEENQKFVVVEYRFGVDVIDLATKKSSSFDPTYTPNFPTQRCD